MVILLLVGFAVLVGCGDDGASSPVGTNSAAQLASVMAGSDVVLSPGDVRAADAIGLDLVSLRVPLERWWTTIDDPAVAESAWVDEADGLLKAMTSTVDHLAAQLGPGRDEAVRATYTPYLTRWRAILKTLTKLRDAVAVRDVAAQQDAVATYNELIATVGRLDADRVARVVEVYGLDEATRALQAEGLNPQSLGLGS